MGTSDFTEDKRGTLSPTICTKLLSFHTFRSGLNLKPSNTRLSGGESFDFFSGHPTPPAFLQNVSAHVKVVTPFPVSETRAVIWIKSISANGL